MNIICGIDPISCLIVVGLTIFGIGIGTTLLWVAKWVAGIVAILIMIVGIALVVTFMLERLLCAVEYIRTLRAKNIKHSSKNGPGGE